MAYYCFQLCKLGKAKAPHREETVLCLKEIKEAALCRDGRPGAWPPFSRSPTGCLPLFLITGKFSGWNHQPCCLAVHLLSPVPLLSPGTRGHVFPWPICYQASSHPACHHQPRHQPRPPAQCLPNFQRQELRVGVERDEEKACLFRQRNSRASHTPLSLVLPVVHTPTFNWSLLGGVFREQKQPKLELGKRGHCHRENLSHQLSHSSLACTE